MIIRAFAEIMHYEIMIITVHGVSLGSIIMYISAVMKLWTLYIFKAKTEMSAAFIFAWQFVDIFYLTDWLQYNNKHAGIPTFSYFNLYKHNNILSLHFAEAWSWLSKNDKTGVWYLIGDHLLRTHWVPLHGA